MANSLTTTQISPPLTQFNTNVLNLATNQSISSPNIQFIYNPAKAVIYAVVLSIFSMISIPLNLFNLITLYRNPILHNMNNLLIGNLALVDFLNGLIVLPLIILTSLIGYPGHFICQLQGFFVLMLYLASLSSTSAISVDRFYAVIKPFRYSSIITPKKCIIITLYIWLIPLIFGITPTLGLQKYGLGRYFLLYFCAISFEKFQENYLIHALLMFYIIIIMFVIMLSYGIMFYVAYRKSVQDLTANSTLRRSIRTTVLLVGTNIICWLPWLAYSVDSYQTRNIFNLDKPTYLNIVSLLLVFSNTAMNPVIYSLTNSQLRAKLRKILPSFN
ncbi:Adenosine receptor A2b [Trichoplax sp. H2]|nr:Adenosine receptor A2b [Trichoplax sp. H2]|eukprot:RDD36637.1 Adenosine receptor A2b [Trichoplax sp. H2]